MKKLDDKDFDRLEKWNSLSKSEKKDISDKLKKLIKHYIDIEMYGNEVSKEFIDLYLEYKGDLDSIIDECDYLNTKYQYKDIEKKIKERMSDFGTNFADKMREKAGEVIGIETAFLAGLYGLTAPKSLSVSRITFPSYNKKETLDTESENLKRKIENAYINASKTGLTFGQSGEQIKQNVANNLKATENNIKSDTKTMTSSFARITDRIIYESNRNPPSGYLYSAVLDSRTCLVCADMNGRYFKNDEYFDMPPLHNSCRCVCVPCYGDVVPKIPTYQEFLEEMSDDELYEYLGKSRYEYYKQNPDFVKEFVDNGKSLTLEEIKERIDNLEE